jgi:putative flippase GtrA
MKQFSRFLVVGVFNTFLGYCVIFACMYWARMSPEASNVTGYAIGLVASYLLNKNYTFNSRRRQGSEIIRFLVVFIIAYASNLAALSILIHRVGVHEGISQILAGIIYVIASYLMNKHYVFRTNDTHQGGYESLFFMQSIKSETPHYSKPVKARLKSSPIFNRFGSLACTIARINSQPTPSWKEYSLTLIAIIFLFLFLFGPALYAKFYIVEDHLLPEGISRSLLDWLSFIESDIRLFARFRPAYWLYVAMGDLLFGVNPHLWHASIMLWGVITCYLFYIALRKIGADIASSFIFVLLLVLSDSQSWIWLNLIPQETIGMMFSAVAVWAIVLASSHDQPSRWDVLALIAMGLAGLVKESFVILIPALLLLRLTCRKCFSSQSWNESLRSLYAPLAAGTLIFTVEITVVMIILLSKPTGYSANASNLSVTSFDPRQWLQLVSTFELAKPLVWAFGVWIGLLGFYKEINRTHLLVIAVIFAAWLAPQLVLYTNGIHDRYFFPAIVSVAAAIALGLSILWHKQYLRPLWVIGVLLLLPILVNGVKSTTTTVGSLTAETQATDRMIEFLAQNVPANQTILMAGDSGTAYGFEATYALPLYLRLAGSNSPFYLWPLLSKGERSPMHIAASGNNTAFHYPDNLNPTDVGAIIIIDTFVPGLSYQPLIQWLSDTGWREISFTVPYYSFSIPDFKYVKVGESNHKVLLPAPPSNAVPNNRPLIAVDHSLAGIVSVSPLLDAPPWGLERDYAGPGSIVWLGQGDKEGLGGVLSSAREQSVSIDFEATPGPSRPNPRRTVEFSVENSAGQYIQREIYEDGRWKFNIKLQPGANHFRVKILDEAIVPIQPNGDTRHLLALLRRITIRG